MVSSFDDASFIHADLTQFGFSPQVERSVNELISAITDWLMIKKTPAKMP